MANTYTQLHKQFVFVVKYRAALIQKEWSAKLYKYITGISSLIQNVKTESSKWIKEQKLCSSLFAWQEGYGAFSYSKSQVPDIIRYIQSQEVHHKKERS